MSNNIIDAIFVKLGLDTTEYKKGVKEAGDTSQKFAKDEEKRDKARQDSHKKLTEAERSAAKERSQQEKERDAQARNAINQLNAVKNAVMGAFGVTLGTAGVQKFLQVVIEGNAELYRQSKMLNTEMKSLDVWMRVADDYRKGSGQGVVATIQGLQQAKIQASRGDPGGSDVMAKLQQTGIDPRLLNDTDKFIPAVLDKLDGKSPQEQLYFLSRFGAEGLLPLAAQSKDEREKNLSYAKEHSAKNQEQGKTAYDIDANNAKNTHNVEATADKVSDPLLEIIKKLTKFMTEHADAVGYATGGIWALGTAATVVAGVRGLGALAGRGGAAAGSGVGGAAAAGGAAGLASRAAKLALRGSVPAALALYSSDLNSGEDEEVAKSRAKAQLIQALMTSGVSYEDAFNIANGRQPSRSASGKIGGLGGTGANSGALTTQTQRMQGVIRAFMNQGLSVEQAQILAAEVGRENSFKSEFLFGNHTDAANGKKNVGMFSWQGPRADKLLQYLKVRGLVDESGNIRQTQAALNHQAGFFVDEMRSGNNAKWSKAWEILNNPDASREEKSNAVGRYGIQWAIDNPKYAASGIKNREDYYTMLSAMGVAGSTINNTNSNNQTAEVRIDNITIQADAKDVNGIASRLPGAIERTNFLPGFVTGNN